MSLTHKEATAAYNAAQAELAQAKIDNAPKEVIAELRLKATVAQATASAAKAQNSEEDTDKKALADLKRSKATLKENFDKLWQEHIVVQNKLQLVEFELRQLKAKYEPSTTNTATPTAHTYGPKPQPAVKPGPIDFSDLFPDWDETR
jgi:hypothetical protein